MEFPKLNPNQLTAPGSGRSKVRLSPGHSMLDWIRLGKQNNLSGIIGGPIVVSEEELAKHNKETDCWMSLRGHVYNVTKYIPFHPGGGPEIMRAAGKDGTELFDTIHKWVNSESMLKSCYVGKLISDRTYASRSTNKKLNTSSSSSLTPGKSNSLQNMNDLENSLNKSGSKSIEKLPVYTWKDKDEHIEVALQTTWSTLSHDKVYVEVINKRQLKCFVARSALKHFTIYVDLFDQVENEVEVWTLHMCLYIRLRKVNTKHGWSKLGTSLNGDCRLHDNRDITYKDFTLTSIAPSSADTNLFTFTAPANIYVGNTIGYHVYLQRDVQGTLLCNPYSVCCGQLLPSTKTTKTSAGGVQTVSSEASSMFQAYKDEPDIQKSGNCLCLMIKIYPEGSLTQTVGKLQIGDTVRLSQPFGSFDSSRLSSCSRLVLVAAGTGVVPMFTVIHNAIYMKYDCDMNLLYYMKTEKDIYWKKELEQLSKENSRFKVTYILSSPSSCWTGHHGRINASHLDSLMERGESEQRRLVCVCGPPAFTDNAYKLILNHGYKKDQIHLFIE